MSTTTTAGAATSAWRHRAESTTAPLDDETLERVDAWWRAANYLSVGQIYLLNNPLLRTPLSRDDVKPRLLGHWGTTPGLNFLYAHMNRAISERELSAMYITGPGHGGPGLVANTYLEGTYTETYPDITQDEEGMRRLFKQFSFPGGIPSHVAPETPGSIHEGGELGYALSHAYGAAFDNPDLLVFAVVGDGEAETGPLATSWHSNKFVDPAKDGVVLPILHLNGYKIANPTVLARIPEEELADLMRGYGHKPHFFEGGFEGDTPAAFHRRFAELLDVVLDEIADIKAKAATTPEDQLERPQWPMIVFKSPKGWTGPKEIDGKRTENSWRSHQVPLANARDTAEHLKDLETWLKSYRAEELFDESGKLKPEIAALAPTGFLRMSANPVTNGGLVLKDLRMPDWRDFAVDVQTPGAPMAEATRVLGKFLTEVIRLNPDNFRIFGPDETASNRLQAVYEVTNKQWNAEYLPTDDDDHLARAGRVMEMLSEHQCQGWLEGYLLTGRHGLMNSYEAFIHIVDSMFNQHAKWLKVTDHIPWRRPIASLNYLLSSHVWRQDHNGFSHQDPGFIDHVVNKKADIIRVYLPPDTNTLLATYDHVLRSKQYVNVVVAGKQPAPSFLSMDEAIKHCARGLGIWDWAGTEVEGEAPDVVLGCAGDVPTLEILAAADLLRRFIPELKVRVVNVVDLMRLQDEKEHPHGLSDRAFDTIFTTDKPVVFAYHGYPWLIHRLTYRRHGHSNIHVRGYKEEGTTTTPFDMVMLNDLDRYHLVMDVIDRVPGLGEKYGPLRQKMMDARLEARMYTREHGEDIPRVADWVWPDVGETATAEGGPAASIDTGGDNE
ncbi:phosphoketolase family protein [Georgenia ruanii]|uniref:Probable phosphoketolase n=1 Tax=Georgenia ruanii TaxID=348442 RepID=A0A7J9US42_9MICO|nr:phosphoketolase family protein [Georgenia ruanii]MPV87436.1 phosphoketolase [Georgenia ruanii]